jgi:hypothetical protein
MPVIPATQEVEIRKIAMHKKRTSRASISSSKKLGTVAHACHLATWKA